MIAQGMRKIVVFRDIKHDIMKKTMISRMISWIFMISKSCKEWVTMISYLHYGFYYDIMYDIIYDIVHVYDIM
jgi:hypothetical protein